MFIDKKEWKCPFPYKKCEKCDYLYENESEYYCMKYECENSQNTLKKEGD